MEFQEMTLEELQAIYTKRSIWEEGEGFYLRRVGKAGQRLNPNLQIHVPCLGLPLENGKTIDLMRGFTGMPKLSEIMSLDPSCENGFLFCADFRTETDNRLYINHEICHVTLCDPDSAKYVLIVTAFAPGSSYLDGMFSYGDLWSAFTAKRSRGSYYGERYSYSLVPIGFRNLPEGEAQTSDDREKTKYEIIQTANRYLGIEFQPNEKTGDADFHILAAESLADNEKHDLAEKLIPGLVPMDKSMRLWAYHDDLIFEDCWVIDPYGRLIAPTLVIDHKDEFIGAELAEWRIWKTLPGSAIILTCLKPSIADEFGFTVIDLPEFSPNNAQVERVAQLERQIQQDYGGRISPYSDQPSPNIGEGWGLWKHAD